MKILIATALLGALGAGSFHFAHATSAKPAPPVAPCCEAEPQSSDVVAQGFDVAAPSCDTVAQSCAGPAQSCDAVVKCVAPGVCEVSCKGPDGASCSMQIACDGQSCQAIGCAGPQDCAGPQR